MKKVIFVWCLFCQAVLAQPLQLLPTNSHYFLYQGKPMVVIGSGEHYGALINLDFDYKTYLDAIKSDGLNTTRLFMGAYYELPGAFGIEKNTLAPKPESILLPWQKVGDKYDLNVWDDAYFARLTAFMQKAQANSIIVEITLFSSYYGAGWAYHPFHGNNNTNGTPINLRYEQVNTLDNGNILAFQEQYVKKIVNALNTYDNFYFEIQNEPWADSKENVLVWNDYIQADDLKEKGNNWRNTLEVPSKASQLWHQKVSSWIVETEKDLPKTTSNFS
ncbi:MAG: glycoside hydrolase family 5 protein [Saprospiraceae bacterium]|nr:glycoside hydrolase family 5 protein [Saprospiraceae bacterium]